MELSEGVRLAGRHGLLEVIEATGVLEVDVGWVNGNYQRILFHSVRTASPTGS